MKMNEYSVIAGIYDKINSGVDYEKWGDLVESLFEKHLPEKPELLLDLACGTGSGSVAAVLWLTGKLPGGKLAVENPGGTLLFELQGTEQEVTSILMTGPAEKLGEHEV